MLSESKNQANILCIKVYKSQSLVSSRFEPKGQGVIESNIEAIEIRPKETLISLGKFDVLS